MVAVTSRLTTHHLAINAPSKIAVRNTVQVLGAGNVLAFKNWKPIFYQLLGEGVVK
jgi:hypothetical protein